MSYFQKKPEPPKDKPKERPRSVVFSTDEMLHIPNYESIAQERTDALVKSGFKPFHDARQGQTMDFNLKSANNPVNIMPPIIYAWYASQTFIGWQSSAILAQHWLISKCCLMPARDAVRCGYEITVNDGQEVDPEVLDYIKKCDVRYRLNRNLIELVQMGRIFGIRIAMFIVDSDDPEFYKKPFNIDGVKEGSYRGISQIDPYWMTPQLDTEAAGVPMAIDFYVPTWWMISGRLVHKSHLIIYKTEEVADLLKPTYLYGGVPIPQKIYERVYAAERVANEAPLLALTKRTDVITVDLAQAMAEGDKFAARINHWVQMRDNYGIKALGENEKMEQFDTSLADLDAVIMTQYQLVAAAANVPVVKLLGTTPKGFNATGEYEESSYHEELESIQTHDLTPLIERHHLLLIKSEVAPKFKVKPFSTTVSWNSLDAMTADELANVNKTRAETDNILMTSGAIDGEDIRNRIINDPKSGYNGMEADEERFEQETEGL